MKPILMRTAIVLFLLPAILNACTKEAAITSSADAASQEKLAASENIMDAAVYKTYTIDLGNHYAEGKHFPLFSGKQLSFSAIFDSSAIYNFTDKNTKYDQNTLYGFADNKKDHRLFSARFGWRWFDNHLQIAAYTFNNGDSTIVEMDSVRLGTPNNYKITVYDTNYVFTLNNKSLSLSRKSTTASAGNYKLLPYFGGDAVAPHTITIKIKNN